MVTHPSVLTSILDLFLLSEVATTWQTDSTAYKLKSRSFYKSIHLQVNLVDFHSWCEPYLTVLSDFQVCCCFWAVLSAKFFITVLSTKQLLYFKVQIAFSCCNSLISTLVPLLETPFNIILCFSNNLTYLPNTLQCSRHIHQRDQLSSKSLSYTIQPGQTVSPVSGLSIISADNNYNWENASATNTINNLTFNRLTSSTYL